MSSRVDLSGTDEEILARMRRSTRTKTRKAGRDGLQLRVGGEAYLTSFRRIVEATGRRQGFSPYPARYYETMWRVFAPSGNACLLMAECDGRVLSSILLVALGDRAVCKMGAGPASRRACGPTRQFSTPACAGPGRAAIATTTSTG